MKKSNQQVVLHIEVSPEAVWQVIGAVSGVEKWFAPVIQTCEVHGDKRVCGIEGGATFQEDIEVIDHKHRTLQYSIPTQPMIPVRNLAASMKVLADEHGQAVIEWSGEFDVEPDLETTAKEMLTQAWTMGIHGIEQYVTATPEPIS